MAFYKPEEITEIATNTGVSKVQGSILKMLILGFFGGAFIAFGFLLDIRVMGTMPAEWLCNIYWRRSIPNRPYFSITCWGRLNYR